MQRRCSFGAHGLSAISSVRLKRKTRAKGPSHMTTAPSKATSRRNVVAVRRLVELDLNLDFPRIASSWN